MAGFVSKQPNGLYCRFSTVTDCPTAWNMTREDYINMKMQEAKEEAEVSFGRKEREVKYGYLFNSINWIIGNLHRSTYWTWNFL